MTDTVSVDNVLVVTNSILEEVEGLSDMSAIGQESWLAEASQALRKWGRAQDYTVMMEAQVLYTVHKAWGVDDEGGSLRKEVTAPWNYDFYKWARTYTKRGARKPSNITIANKISVFRDWVAEKNISCPDKVDIPKRDSFGELVNEELIDPDKDWEEVPFNPMDCDYSKLLIARGKARSGEMNVHAWTALRDPFATAEDLTGALRESRDYQKTDSGSFKIYQEAGMLFAEENDVACAFLAIVPEGLSQAVGRKALVRVKKALGLPVGDEALAPPTMVYDIASVEEDKLVICVNGVKFSAFSWEEAVKIRESIDELKAKLEKSGRLVN